MKSSFYLFILLPVFSFAQVQWATKVIEYSSQYGDDLYSAEQALGFPNAMNDAGLSELAWVPRKEDSPFGEYIQVGFERPARIRQVAIAESLNPGAISKIILVFEDGEQSLIYANKDPKPLLQPLRLFRKTFDPTQKAVTEVRLVLDTKAIPGSNQIDAIGISETTEPIELRPEVLTAKGGAFAALPQPLGPNINSNFAERLPILSPDGKTLYFARKYHPDNLGKEDQDDIWIAQAQANGRWSNAQNPGAPLNNVRHNFVFATNPSGTILYLANHYSGNAKDGISLIRKQGNGWSKPEPMPIEDFYNDNPFVSYHVSNDGRYLLMAIEREEGFGDRDLYVSFRKEGNSWSRPLNLGPIINTVGIENSVFLAADNRTIYFSSSGHPGFGGLDIFLSRRLDDSWTNWSIPQNMDQVINSPQNEYNYTMPASGAYAFFTRDDQNRMSDIYRAWLPEALKPDPVALITGRLIDADTKQPIQGAITFQSLNDHPEALEDLDPSSRFQTIVPLGSEVGIVAKKDGYWAVSEALDLKDGTLEELDQSEGGYTHSTTALVQGSDQPEIRALQNELKTLDYELNQLSTRSTPLPKPAAEPFKPK
ncbi:MAG: PD40 domain-containing protein, partial [Phaeodactylibacter sp.]|nr:PD40 domain-containing protein [Phaeodactylibacter sp.]